MNTSFFLHDKILCLPPCPLWFKIFAFLYNIPRGRPKEVPMVHKNRTRPTGYIPEYILFTTEDTEVTEKSLLNSW